jgi:hypothetical protein
LRSNAIAVNDLVGNVLELARVGEWISETVPTVFELVKESVLLPVII